MTEAALLTVDLAALAANYTLLKNKVAPSCQTAAVIKADAYGLGLEKVWSALENQDCPFYFVATPEEALTLRALTTKPIGVFNGIAKSDTDAYIRHNLIPVLNSLSAIETWRNAAAKHDIALPSILHFDTGMNRLGLGSSETEDLLRAPQSLQGLDLKLIMSHFACADDEDHRLTGLQYDRFAAIAARFPNIPASLSSSSGIFRSPAYHFNLVRPGMALYGLNPTPESPNPMRAVVTLEAPILQVRRARRGESVGYGAGHRLSSDTTLATVGIGYADGFLRAFSGRATLYYKGRPCPIAGRVSMDLTIIDMGEHHPEPGEMIEILGPHQSPDTLAAHGDTIGYEVLTSLGPRYKRIYKS